MASFPSRGVVVVLLFLTPVYSSELDDQELRSTLAVNQLALKEQSFALTQHSQALSQLLQEQEGNQLDSQGVSQALVQMAQGFQTTVSQLSQELSSLIQLNKELATQQSSSLTELTEMAENIRLSQSHLEERMASSQRNITETLTETLTTLLNQKSETTNGANQEVCPTLPTLSVHPEAQDVSDGRFLIVEERKTWEDARQHCFSLGGVLASPPADMDAFRTFVYNAIGGWIAWLGAREEESGGYKYLDGRPVEAHHWQPRQPNQPDSCLYIYADSNPPLWDGRCDGTLHSICRFK